MKKKILFIDGPLCAGGAERVLIDILQNFDYDKYEVDLALICKEGPLIEEIPSQVNIIELWKGYSWNYKIAHRLSLWFRCNWLYSCKMNGRKLKKDYDLEISFLEGMPLKLHALRKSKAKKITWVHADLYNNPYESSQFYAGEELKAYDTMDMVINVSKGCEKGFIQRFPECKVEKKVIYNPINIERIKNLSHEKIYPRVKDIFTDIQHNEIIIVNVGRVTQVKNPKRFIQVAELSHSKGLPFRFLWIGEGDLKSKMEYMVKELGLENTVKFYGYTNNPYALMKDCDVFLLTSDSESFSLVLCEAMALNLAVLSTNTSGPCEIIGENKYGYLCNKSPNSIISQLSNLYNENQKLAQISIKASERIELFSVKNISEQIQKLIMNI